MVKTHSTPQTPGKVGYYTVTKEELLSRKAKLEATLNCTLRESAEDRKTLEGSTIKFFDVNGLSIASCIHSIAHGLYRLAVSNFGIVSFDVLHEFVVAKLQGYFPAEKVLFEDWFEQGQRSREGRSSLISKYEIYVNNLLNKLCLDMSNECANPSAKGVSGIFTTAACVKRHHFSAIQSRNNNFFQDKIGELHFGYSEISV